jgi:hypothetical protein
MTAAPRVEAAARATIGEVLPVVGFVAERRQGAQVAHPRSQAARAKEGGVSRRTQQKLGALARVRPDLLEAVRAGRISAHRAAVEAGIIGKAAEHTDSSDDPDQAPWRSVREAVERLVACPVPIEQLATAVPFYRVARMAANARTAIPFLAALAGHLERRCGGRAGDRP